MENGILTTTKAALGIEEDYTAYDNDIVMHINSVFSNLHQLGIGPDGGYEITITDVAWDDYLDGDSLLNNIKTYMYLSVRMLFDPPATPFHLDSMKEQIRMFEWRINAQREEASWVSPTTQL